MPCTVLIPTLEEKVVELKGKIAFAKVDIDALRELAVQNSVKSVPHIVILNKGKAVKSKRVLQIIKIGHVGMPTKVQIESLLKFTTELQENGKGEV